MDSTNRPMLHTYLKVAGVVAAYWFVSIALVFINKYLLSSPDLKLDAPLFVTWFQCVVSVGLCLLLVMFSSLSIQLDKDPWFVAKQVIPVSVVFVGMISFNNLCLKHVGVSFYYVGRSLTTIFNVLMSYIILQQRTSNSAIACCGVIVLGFLLGVDQEKVSGSLSMAGILYGVLASACVALYSIYIKKVLPHVQNNIVALMFYNNVNAIFLFLPLIILTQEPQAVVSFHALNNPFFWFVMLVGGVFGFVIGFLISLQVQVTSPLTNNISGTAKSCAQTVLATVWFNESKPVLWWVSNGIVLLGSAAYTRVRQIEMHREWSQKSVEREKSQEPA